MSSHQKTTSRGMSKTGLSTITVMETNTLTTTRMHSPMSATRLPIEVVKVAVVLLRDADRHHSAVTLRAPRGLDIDRTGDTRRLVAVVDLIRG